MSDKVRRLWFAPHGRVNDLWREHERRVLHLLLYNNNYSNYNNNNFIPAVLHSIYPTYRCEWLAKSCSEFYHPRYPLQMYRMWSESQGNCECKKFQEVQNHHHKTFPPKPLLHPAVKAVKKTTHRDSSFKNAGVLIKYPSWLWSRTWRVCELLFQKAKEPHSVDKPGSAWRFVQPVNLVS